MNSEIQSAPLPLTNWRLYLKAAVGGFVGALLAFIPVAIIKTIGALIGVCKPLGGAFGAPVGIWTCGITYNTIWSTLPAFIGFMVFVVLGGIFFTLIATFLCLGATNGFGKRTPRQRRLRTFWWGLGFGVLFDLVFVSVFFYLPQ